MTTAEMIGIAHSFGSNLAVKMSRWGRLLWEILTFSLADDRIAPRRCLSVVMETGGVSFVYRSRFLFRMKNRGTRRYPTEAGKYPAPENLAAATALAAGELKAAAAQITLVIPRAWAILKTTEFPLTVKKNLSNVVSYELDRLTPLSSERALYDFLILGEDENRIRIMLAAMKAETLQPYEEALRERGFAVSRVALAVPGAPGHDLCGKEDIHTGGMNLLDQGVHKTQKTPMALTILFLAVLATSGLFWMASPLQIEQKRVEAIDREIAARRDEVKRVEALKKEIEEVQKERAVINGFRTSRPITLDLLKELTRVLPDNAWLSRVRCTETTVDIEGYAATATEILPKLETSGYFKKVDFASPTLRDTRLNADRFVIKMEIERLPEAKAGNENE